MSPARLRTLISLMRSGVTTVARDLHDNVVLLAILFEAGHQTATEHGLQRAANDVDVGADVEHLVAIDANAQLWRVHAQIGVDVLGSRGSSASVLHGAHEALHLLVRHRGEDDKFNRLRAGSARANPAATGRPDACNTPNFGISPWRHRPASGCGRSSPSGAAVSRAVRDVHGSRRCRRRRWFLAASCRCLRSAAHNFIR